ncbi:MAG: hypothetical protein HOP27_13700, partial [Anaerolineales bacterium]|nr:hypothetical protein [Anaerolineales bacterium]
VINQSWVDIQNKLWLSNLDGLNSNDISLLYRLERFSLDEDYVHFYLTNTNYKDAFGTNISHPELATIYGVNFLANPLAICGLIFSSDEKILLFHRSSRVLDRPDFWHTIGGHLIRPKKRSFEEKYIFDETEIVNALSEEIQEELKGFDTNTIKYLPLCFIRDTNTQKNELCYLVHSQSTVESIVQNLNLNFEHNHDYKILPLDLEIIGKFLSENYSRIVPSTKASLYHFCLLHFGEERSRYLLERIGKE